MAPPKVSVVVPVYNPGPAIDVCIASLLRQSLPADEYEAIFVDDGSTDGTGERLEALAAEHPNVTTIRIPNSGWPGRPRNVGTDAARGDYVLYVDNDDWLDDEALERLHAAAVRDDADIVLGKVIGHRRSVSRELFRRNRSHARLLQDPLLSLLSPHKLFRRAFLREHGLRFPEGRRRLEDHVLVVPAYFAARSITILADHPIYHWIAHTDGSNASVQPLTAAYFDDVREVLDLVEARTEPGEFRDRMLAHWYRSKVLVRLGTTRLLKRPREQWDELFTATRSLARDRFGPAVTAKLGATLRVRARLLVDGRLDGLEALARAEGARDPALRLTAASWADGVLRLELAAAAVTADGEPVPYRREDGRLRLVLPDALPGGEGVTPEDRDVEDELPRARLTAFVRERETGEEYLVPARSDVTIDEDPATGRATLAVTARAELDVATIVAEVGPLTAGVWDLWAELHVAGQGMARRIPVGDVPVPAPALLDGARGTRLLVPYATTNGKLSLDLDAGTRALTVAARPAAADARATRDGDDDVVLRIPVPVHVTAAEGSQPARLALRTAPDADPVELPAELAHDAGGAALVAHVPRAVGPGPWRLAAAVADGPERGLGLVLDVGADGEPTVRRPAKARPAAAEAPAASPLRRALARVRPLRAVVRALRR